jgi:hypothetical protein
MRPQSKPQINLAKRLTYSGTLPLLSCTLGFYSTCTGINFQAAAITYAMLIIAFLSGIHWAIYLSSAKKCPSNLFLSSNAITLLAYTTFFIPQPAINLGLDLICFWALLYYEKTLCALNILPLWYYRLRRNATVIVSLLLIILGLPSLYLDLLTTPQQSSHTHRLIPQA